MSKGSSDVHQCELCILRKTTGSIKYVDNLVSQHVELMQDVNPVQQRRMESTKERKSKVIIATKCKDQVRHVTGKSAGNHKGVDKMTEVCHEREIMNN